MTPAILVFDVNETLLDLSALRPAFERLLGTADAMGEWFARMLHGSLVANHVGRYRPFGMIGVEALLVVAAKRNIDVDPDAAADLVGEMRRLPAHPDVAPALARLGARFRLATLTNGSEDVASDQLASAGLDGFFEKALSVDMAGRFKPAPEVYLLAAARLGVEIDEMMMVAAHDWDIVGARSVGAPGAYVARPGAVWGLADNPPDVVGRDLDEIADRLLAP